MDLHYLRLFHALALMESYTKAADMLHISQPALSVQIKKFEDRLGIKLFDKAGHKIILNENGKILFEYADRIFSLVEEAEHQLLNKSENISGTITIGGSNTPGTYILPGIVGEFKRLYPYVNINMHISNTSEIAYMVTNNKLDFAINGGNMEYNDNIYVEKLMEDRVVLSASPLNALSQKEYIEPLDLIGLDFIAHESNSQLFKLAESIINEIDIPFKITMTFGHIDAVKQAVAANLGISPIPYSAVAMEIGMGLIKELKIRDKEWTYPYSLIYNKNKYLSPAAKELIGMIRNRIMK
jgi:DNA-binding transcriptional LysR family regulator